ncbi:FMN-dependent NADH-azoreductase [Carnobacterium viridans]|uniref:FMN dependent NADH:quinone oxidoreductase n=1 Tax=Carnobacterium viridans TaxID=174587 RepID=A0A1H0YPQ9_9LACT|nr:FMN-dependent NADH-azoreductase [Carnobacterium viridans]UDE95012.1 FMN-dependent NADH-azoreductase [Carnobacterium viridans]SDQ17174.1 FMN-dependent NADH-azoreductase [Carnobacterium viridans]
MTHLLVVRAHPLDSEHSRSMQVTDAFVKSYTESHPEDTIEDINLYDLAVPDIDRNLLQAWSELGTGIAFDELSEAKQQKITLFNGYTNGFLHADKVVIANPLWNLNVPARLKAWVDTITVAGKTFKYNEKGEAVGLAGDKKVLHIQANGGVYDGKDPANQYLKTILTYIGVSDFQELFVEGMDYAPDKAADIIAEGIEKATALGKTF